MTPTPHTLIALLFAAPMIVGCSGTAHILRVDARGGEVALEGVYSERVTEARLLAIDHCGGRVQFEDPSGAKIDAPDRDDRSVEFICVADDPTQLAVNAR